MPLYGNSTNGVKGRAYVEKDRSTAMLLNELVVLPSVSKTRAWADSFSARPINTVIKSNKQTGLTTECKICSGKYYPELFCPVSAQDKVIDPTIIPCHVTIYIR